MSEEKLKEPRKLSRREFLKDAGIVVGGTAVGSAFLLTACGEPEEITKTVTKTNTTTATQTATATVTAPGGTVTQTATQTLSKFVCPYDGQEFDSLEALKAHLNAEHGGESPTDVNFINLSVNGDQYVVQVKPNLTLAEVLREKLGLTGTKQYCNLGECGHCSVILDDRLVEACLVLAVECDGSNVLTIEGLGKAELHPIQKAFLENMGFQCGICTPGMIISTKALLDANPNPNLQEIQQALSGVMCKCGNYRKIFQAVTQAATMNGGN